jgi:hypothetical protein
VGADCASHVCTGTPGALTCAAPSCFDSVKNGTETDFDCGGLCAQKCPTYYSCLVNADCIGGLCDPIALICAPSCTDGYQDGGETDVDCGGPCLQKCGLFQHCSSNSDCANNHCETGCTDSHCQFGHCTPP